MQTLFLAGVERKLVMEDGMKLGSRLGRRRNEHPSDDHACDRGDERKDGDKRQAPRVHRDPTKSVEGANGLGAPKGERTAASAPSSGTALLSIPIARATPIAVSVAPAPTAAG
jgi:hypothetical protein